MLQRVLAASLIAACLLVTGCTAAPAEKPSAAPAAGGMGGGMGGASGESNGMVEGFVAAPENCVLELGAGSRVSSDGVSVSRVVAPADGWVVVSSALSPGRVLGQTWVRRGESQNVLVKLTAVDGPRAVLSLHVDRGTPRVYEFDPARPIRSYDAQVFVARAPVQSAMALSTFGADVLANSVLIQVDDQPAGESSVRVAYLLTPGPSWISVTAVKEGAPAKLLGRIWRAAGEYQQVVIPLEGATSAGDILVAVHQDAGIRHRFDYTPSDPLGSPDQPYRSAGELAIKQILLNGK